MMTPAEELRAAAQRIREVAADATPGPWGVGNGNQVARDVEQLSVGSFTCLQSVADTDVDRDCWADDESSYVETEPEADAEHIALWDPTVAELVAKVLDCMVEVFERIDWLNSRPGDARTRVVSFTDQEQSVLALARAINGSAS